MTGLHPDIERVALLGWHLYPASTRTKAACIKNPTPQATCDLDQLARWTHDFHSPNWRVVFGPSKLIGLDIDIPVGHAHDGIANLKALVEKHGALPDRPTARSGSGGMAVFFKDCGDKIIGDAGHPALGIDPRRGAQSQMIPPSIHVTWHKQYRWLVPPWEVSPPPAPRWLLDMLKPVPVPEWKRNFVGDTPWARQIMFRATMAVATCADGDRNNTLNRKSYVIGRLIAASKIDEREAVEQLYGAAVNAGIDRPEAIATIKSGIKAGLRNPWVNQP